MIEPSVLKSHYGRKEVQEQLVRTSQSKEVAVRFSDKGYGKRPDTLYNPYDVFELAKQGATSFHCSEELWTNPLHLITGMKRQKVDEIRAGWDFILDIDSPFWIIAKITTWLLVKSLHEFGLRSVSVKFSGNKGFHIAVPFQAFPEKLDDKETKFLFPEAPRAMALYLLKHIGENHIVVKNNIIHFGGKFSISFDKLKKLTGKSEEELLQKFCAGCKKKITEERKPKVDFQCPGCGEFVEGKAEEIDVKVKQCPRCNKLMEKMVYHVTLCSCGSNDYFTEFKYDAIIEVDTILISHRHLYRGLYSLHEKSGLASIPISVHKILSFDKKQAEPKNLPAVLQSGVTFLDRENADHEEGSELMTKSMALADLKKQEKRQYDVDAYKEMKEAIPIELFPPCMHNMLAGLKDGKKRAMFMMTNFLRSAGWTPDAIEGLLHTWNEKNPEPLRETNISGHIRYLKQKASQKPNPPPSCDNKMYYIDLGVCTPDGLCKKIKNPIQYVKRKLWFKQREEQPEKPKRTLSEEQKKKMQDARKKYKEFREKMKEKLAAEGEQAQQENSSN